MHLFEKEVISLAEKQQDVARGAAALLAMRSVPGAGEIIDGLVKQAAGPEGDYEGVAEMMGGVVKKVGETFEAGDQETPG